MSAFTAPESFHVLWVAGRSHFIDDVTRKEIEDRLGREPDKCETMTFDSIPGFEVTIVLYSVTSIESSTPESRERDHAFHVLLNGDEQAFE